MQPTNLDRFGFDVQKDFLMGNRQEVERRAIESKTMALFAAAIAAVVGVILSVLALAALPASFGFSALLLIPAALAFTAANDLFRISRCFDIVAARAQANESGQHIQDLASFLVSKKAPWIKAVQKEIDNTLLVRPFAYQRADHHVRVW